MDHKKSLDVNDQTLETDHERNQEKEAKSESDNKGNVEGEKSSNSWEDVPEELLEEIKLLSVEIGEETGTLTKQNLREAIQMARKHYSIASTKNQNSMKDPTSLDEKNVADGGDVNPEESREDPMGIGDDPAAGNLKESREVPIGIGDDPIAEVNSNQSKNEGKKLQGDQIDQIPAKGVSFAPTPSYGVKTGETGTTAGNTWTRGRQETRDKQSGRVRSQSHGSRQPKEGDRE